MGDYLCARYGDLRDNPLSVTIENSRIVDIQCDRADLVADFRAYTSTDENSDRVGEFAMGTNIALTDVIGNILQDEKLPTLHIAFGHPYAEPPAHGATAHTSTSSAAASTSGSTRIR